MTPEEIDIHFEKASAALKENLSESKNNYNRLTDLIHTLYSEINKGELIVVTGAFSLAVNFLIQGPEELPYNYSIFLKVSIIFLFLVIVLKFHINRTSAAIATQEREYITSILANLSELQRITTDFLINKKTEEFSKIDNLFQNMENIEKRKDLIGSPKNKKIGKCFNEVEYIFFFIGIAFLLLFFLENI